MCKMSIARQAAVKWRESASLILAAKDKRQPLCAADKSADYKLLLINRPQHSSFMPNSSVFPGGVCETADASPQWLKHFQTFGINAPQLKELTIVAGPRPSMFTTTEEGGLQKEISLRISAIRETFEEVGLLICRDRDNLDNATGYGCSKEDFDRVHWQRVVHKEPAQFLTMCQELDVIPDLWGLHEWSAWLTPPSFKKRFQTVFYMVALNDIPEVIVDKTEVSAYAWKTPFDFLKAFFKQEIWLPPPQFYELSRLLNLCESQHLKDFARKRASNGTTLFYAIQYKCTDGNIEVFPGDKQFLAEPHAPTERIVTNCTTEEFRKIADNQLNRIEHAGKLAVLHVNVNASDGQLCPVQVTNETFQQEK